MMKFDLSIQLHACIDTLLCPVFWFCHDNKLFDLSFITTQALSVFGGNLRILSRLVSVNCESLTEILTIHIKSCAHGKHAHIMALVTRNARQK